MVGTRLPIVLAHGIARFDILRQVLLDKLDLDERQISDTFAYFKGIATRLRGDGFEVHATSVDFAGSVALRAGQLASQISQILAGRPPVKVHIIAHSMGGLDARHMIVDVPGMADKVATLTTIGTPHQGTSFADFGLTLGGALVVDGLRPILHLEGFRDLTTAACRAFNARAEEAEASNGVGYRTYAGSEERDSIFLPLQASWSIIHRSEGPNDGLVSVRSQNWLPKLVAANGRTKTISQDAFPVPADHLNEVGWWDPQEMNPGLAALNSSKRASDYAEQIQQVYLGIARQLAA